MHPQRMSVYARAAVVLHRCAHAGSHLGNLGARTADEDRSLLEREWPARSRLHAWRRQSPSQPV